MSEFIKTQEEIRANLTTQIREVLDGAEEAKRGLDQAELEKIDRIEADIRRADEALEVAKRADVDADALADALLKIENGEDITSDDRDLITTVLDKVSPVPEADDDSDEYGMQMLALKKKKLELLQGKK